ncbi:putative ubiquitin-protein ligase [Peziza echinospora]|nr:putative ubiquitin-protein ligase [Peziza echinospora]
MCCDSAVRWPKHLSTFRCMICLTINDLKPVTQAAGTSPVPPISIETTRTIIEDCVANFLHERRWNKNSRNSPKPTASDCEPSPSLEKIDKTADELGKISLTNASEKSSLNYVNVPRVNFMTSEPTTASSSEPRASNQLLLSGLLNEKIAFDSEVLFTSADAEEDLLRAAQKDVPLTPAVENVTILPEDQDMEAPSLKSFATPEEERIREREMAGSMFKPLEDYLTRCLTSWESLNGSFLPPPPPGPPPLYPRTSDTGREAVPRPISEGGYDKILLNSSRRKEQYRHQRKDSRPSIRSSGIQWDAVKLWYDLIVNAGANIPELFRQDYVLQEALNGAGQIDASNEKLKEKQKIVDDVLDIDELEQNIIEDVEEAREQLTKVVLKATENILKRPGRPLKEPAESRFLLIILANPLIYPSYSRPKIPIKRVSRKEGKSSLPNKIGSTVGREEPKPQKRISTSGNHASTGPGQHSGIVKRIIGLISILPNICHHFIVSMFSRLPEEQFRKIVELGGSFITYRLTRQQRKKPIAGPLGGGKRGKGVIYHDDWQIKAASRFMALLFSANNDGRARQTYTKGTYSRTDGDSALTSPADIARRQAQMRGQIIPTSDFYNMMLDYADLIADFDSWESRSGKFCFCQYPFLFSMGAKIHILEYDARRQMEVKAREAFFNSLSNRRAVNQYLVLKVRRDCLVEDSLKGISEGVGGMGDIKKGLRIEFVGEDGVDAGGLRKEWFLLLVRDVFDPNYGLFVYDEDSRYCYFNTNSFESSEEFFLIGVVLGLAIYNSTILDVALPPCAFKKLLMSTTSSSSLATSSGRVPNKHSLDDLAVFRPALAHGLNQLLEFQGDVEEVFCRNFVAEVDRFGERILVPLVPGGENIPVTNQNRKDFVDKYITYLLDTSVSKQFEPFKRGFYTVCGGNALQLFRPEEIELLVRGSEEALDISALRAVAIYEAWGASNTSDASNATAAAENDPVVKWFWSFFERITPSEQRLLLSFITGSDRIPAMGATNLVIKLVCLGGDCDRFPVARTCFNALCLYRYKRREKLERMLWRAVEESEGFGLK